MKDKEEQKNSLRWNWIGRSGISVWEIRFPNKLLQKTFVEFLKILMRFLNIVDTCLGFFTICNECLKFEHLIVILETMIKYQLINAAYHFKVKLVKLKDSIMESKDSRVTITASQIGAKM